MLILLALIVLGGYALRARGLHRSLWLDELATAWAISEGPAQIPERCWLNNLSPLSFYLTWASSSIFGYNELGLRLPSLAAGLVGIVLASWVVFSLSRSQLAAVVAATLVAIDRDTIRYAVETRPYAIIQFLAMLQAFWFYRATQRPSFKPRVGWAAASVVLFYLHYTTALLLVAEGAYYALVFIRYRGRPAYRPISILADAAVVVLALLPATAHLLFLKAQQAVLSSWISAPQFLMECLRFFSFDKNVFFPSIMAGAVAFASRATDTQVPARRTSLPGSSGGWSLFVFLACWLLVPICMAWAAGYLNVILIFVNRYLIASSLATVIMASLMMLCFGPGWARRTFVVVALALHGAFFMLSEEPDVDKHHWRDAVAYARQQVVNTDSLILVRCGLVEEQYLKADSNPLLLEYLCCPTIGPYWPESDKIRRYPFVKNQTPPDPCLLEQLRIYNKACLLALEDIQDSLNRVLAADAVNNSPMTVVDKEQFGVVFVYMMERDG